jgi:hypothetical protein
MRLLLSDFTELPFVLFLNFSLIIPQIGEMSLLLPIQGFLMMFVPLFKFLNHLFLHLVPQFPHLFLLPFSHFLEFLIHQLLVFTDADVVFIQTRLERVFQLLTFTFKLSCLFILFFLKCIKSLLKECLVFLLQILNVKTMFCLKFNDLTLTFKLFLG